MSLAEYTKILAAFFVCTFLGVQCFREHRPPCFHRIRTRGQQTYVKPQRDSDGNRHLRNYQNLTILKISSKPHLFMADYKFVEIKPTGFAVRSIMGYQEFQRARGDPVSMWDNEIIKLFKSRARTEEDTERNTGSKSND